MDKVGNALKIISQRLDEQVSEKIVEVAEMKGYNIFDLLEQISKEWDKAIRESYRDCWKEILKEDWDRVNVVDEKEYKDVEMRLEEVKYMGD